MSRRSQDVILDNRAPYVPGADTDARFRAALSASLDAIFLFESIRDSYGSLTTFRLVEVNERGADMFGAPRDVMLGRTAEELIAGDPTRGLFNRAARVVETGESLDEVIDLRQIPVKPDWVHHQIVRVGDGVLITSRDVSAQKRAEEALRRSEERHREIVERASDGIYRVDTFGVFTFANPVVSRILGLGAESVLGRNYLEFVRPDYHEAGVALYRRQIKELIPVTYWEFPALTGDGREVWIGQKVHVETEGRWVVGLFAVARDITDRKRAEMALRDSEERYRFLAEQSADMLSRHAPDGTFRYASRAVQPLLGYTPEELPGRTVASLAHPEDVAAVRAAHIRMLGHLGVETVTFRARRRDGTHVWLETTTHAVRDPERGEVVEVLMVSRDVTGRQDREARARRMGALDAMARLAGDVAERLDAKLASLREAADELRRTHAEDDDVSPATVVWKQSNALTNLARRLRAVGRREQLAPELVDANTVIRGIEPAILRIAGDGIAVRFALDPNIPQAYTDPAHLEAALLELARNACEAMGASGMLLVETFARDGALPSGGSGGVAVRMRDTGPGLKGEVRSRLFEPYPLGALESGDGLGLAGVYGVLQQGGGDLTVEPAPGGGTMVSIYLPERL